MLVIVWPSTPNPGPDGCDGLAQPQALPPLHRPSAPRMPLPRLGRRVRQPEALGQPLAQDRQAPGLAGPLSVVSSCLAGISCVCERASCVLPATVVARARTTCSHHSAPDPCWAGGTSSAAPSFGAASGATPSFVSAPATGGGFGAASGFSASTSGGFGLASSAPAFGTASAPAFGAAPSPLTGGGFGAASGAGLGGAGSAPAFGAFGVPPTSAPAFGAATPLGGGNRIVNNKETHSKSGLQKHACW